MLFSIPAARSYPHRVQKSLWVVPEIPHIQKLSTLLISSTDSILFKITIKSQELKCCYPEYLKISTSILRHPYFKLHFLET